MTARPTDGGLDRLLATKSIAIFSVPGETTRNAASKPDSGVCRRARSRRRGGWVVSRSGVGRGAAGQSVSVKGRICRGMASWRVRKA